MKAIVFGGSGFVGSRVADKLTESGYEVTIFDLKTPKSAKKSQKFVMGDMLDAGKVKNAVKGQDIVYNFAGVADIDKATRSPVNTLKINIEGNTNIIEASKENKVKRFVFASSLYVYSESGSFYRCSKQACELIIEEYQKHYGLDYTILRYGSLYGIHADESNWIYSILTQAVKEGKITRYGDGQEIREYIHVEDAARCSVDILREEFKNQSVIIAGQQPIKVCDLLAMIKEILGNKISIEYRSSEKNTDHYEITPYTFKPKLAKRLFTNTYVDLGQGIIQILSHIYTNDFPHKKHNGFFIEGK